jgi:exopolysaccharide biosynthesis protein
MIKRLFTAVVAIVAPVALMAQSADSLTFVKAPWKVQKIDKGITLKEYHFTGDDKIFDSDQYVSIVEIDQKKAKGRFALADNPGKITRTSRFAADSSAVAALNGTFYNMRPPYNSVCYFKKNGTVVYDKVGSMAQRENGAVVIDGKGVLSVEGAGDRNPKWVLTHTAPSIMCSGPMLMADGKDSFLQENSFNRTRHPRSAVATSKNKAYLITVDGRAKGNSAGVSLWEFTKIMHYIGVNDAINVDGGGSTTLYVEGQNENGIVNHPSDNGKFDRKGERSVVNSILFIKK